MVSDTNLPQTVSDTHSATLAATGLTSFRGDRLLFRDLTLTLVPGEFIHVHGPNGSGKTTLLRILCGLTLPTEGEVCWRGRDIRADATAYRREVLYVGHANGVKLELTALENLRFAQALGAEDTGLALEAVLDRFQLGGFEDTLARALSAGQQRRVALARLLACRATLWILDEPFAALDRSGQEMLEDLLDEHLARGGMALLSSHQRHRFGGRQPKELHLR